MHLSSLPRFATSRLVDSPSLIAIGVRADAQCKSRAFCAFARFDRHSRPSNSVHRRQLLTTTSLSLLSSWLPFSTMSASAAFELPGEKWWSEETVAVVTGGELAAPLCRQVYRYVANEQGESVRSEQGYRLWCSQAVGFAGSADSGSCSKW